MITVTLREYERQRVELTTAQLAELRAVVRDRLGVLPTEEQGYWEVAAGSYVGTVVTPDISLLIRPKVSGANLFHMLEAGSEPLPLDPEVFDYDTTGNLVPAFATFFARVLRGAMRLGLCRSYVEHEDLLPGPKGRIEFTRTLRTGGLPAPVACRYDEYSADTALNRIVKAATVRLLALPDISLPTRQSLLVELARMEDVGPVRPDDAARQVSFNRLNRHFEPTYRLACLVLENSSLRDASGSSRAAAFLIDMNQVFEDFIEDRLRRYLRGMLDVSGQARLSLDEGGAVGLRPDLLFRSGSHLRYVADAKYKVVAGNALNADYYQLLAYCSALRLPEGLLIYCQSDGTAPPSQVVVRHSRQRLWSVAVSLAGTPFELEASMRHLAGWIRNRAFTRDQKATHSAAAV